MEISSYNYDKLRGRIVEKCGSIQSFSNAIGVSSATISKYLNNKLEWGQRTIDKAREVLDIDTCDIPAYFFAYKVQE